MDSKPNEYQCETEAIEVGDDLETLEEIERLLAGA